MNNVVEKAIAAVNKGKLAYCKFLSANDTGYTGGHQAGIYIAKPASSMLFDESGEKGTNKDKYVKIRWQDDFDTDSRFIYYGKGTRNEYRITRFGKGFPFLTTEHTGDLFVLVRNDTDDYSGYMLETEEDINAFLDAFAMSPADTGSVIQKNDIHYDISIEYAFNEFIRNLTMDFPASSEMSAEARRIYNAVYDHEENIQLNPDKELIDWINMEYGLFRKIELARYGDMINKGFSSVEEFIEVANMVLNRRKSRAGKSLEHHLSALFNGNSLLYQSQPKTEGNKHPDFLFPGETEYHDLAFPAQRLIFLGAKTTCKDRWRQIINEANRISDKHLFTLQQGISAQQLEKMETEHITLVVPAPYIASYPLEKRDKIWTLKKFILYVKEIASDN